VKRWWVGAATPGRDGGAAAPCETWSAGRSTSPLDRMYPHHRFIDSYVHHGRVGVLIEFGLETWMVTERSEFRELSHGLAMHIAGLDPESLDALLVQAYAKNPAVTVAQVLAAGSAQLGERISITRFLRWTNEPQRPPDPPTPPKNLAMVMRLKRA
jgi:elongation factor Ts